MSADPPVDEGMAKALELLALEMGWEDLSGDPDAIIGRAIIERMTREGRREIDSAMRRLSDRDALNEGGVK